MAMHGPSPRPAGYVEPPAGQGNQKKKLTRRQKKRKRAKNASRAPDAAGSKILRSAKDKKLKANLRSTLLQQEEARQSAARTEVLLPEEAGLLEAEGPLGRTYKFKQSEIREAVDANTSLNVFDLKLDTFGPYSIDYTRAGRHMLLGGRKGHIAMMDCMNYGLKCEMHLRETVRDVQFLMNENLFAVAQRKYAYIYDSGGMEIHCLRNHVQPNALEYLPYHYLLASVGATGYLKYQDVSTGQLVAEHRTKLGPCSVMRQNPRNAVMCLGHANGVVTMWSPNMNEPLVKMFCHHGPLRALAMDRAGRTMVTSGSDGQMKVWDLRTYRQLQAYYTTSPATSLDISQRGLLACGFSSHVQVWKDWNQAAALDALEREGVEGFLGQDAGAPAVSKKGMARRIREASKRACKAKAPYMRHSMPGSQVTAGSGVRFRPYEDVLGIAHSRGMSSMVVPGSGEPNYDTFEANPYESTKQRREGEVHKVLEKVPASMITLESDEVGRVDRAPQEVIMRERQLAHEANNAGKKLPPPKKKMRGRGKIGKKIKKHQRNIMTKQRLARREKLQKQEEARVAEKRRRKMNQAPRTALSRFGK
jgi:U3 small nucleolar RNA-associated protein 7